MSYWNAPRDYQRERESAEREARVRKETPPEAEALKSASASADKPVLSAGTES